MTFFLRKFIEALLVPIGFSCFLMLAGIILRRRLISLAGVLVLLLCSTEAVGLSMLQLLERVYPVKTIAAAPTADAIVVLSGGIVKGENAAGMQWGENSNRYFTGEELALAGKAQWIIFTAGAAANSKGPSQGAFMQQVAIRHGIAPERTRVTREVRTTEDEAHDISQMPGIHSILLVTSASHMPRAVLLFRAQGLEVSPFPTAHRSMGDERVNALSFIPTSGGLRDSEQAMRELYGLAVYRFLLRSRPLGNLRP